jgi:hypothetical protein
MVEWLSMLEWQPFKRRGREGKMGVRMAAIRNLDSVDGGTAPGFERGSKS